MARVLIENLSKRYSPDTPLAVKDLDLDIGDGEFLVLLGPSGCGKTTTLRCIAGLEHQTQGQIHIGNRLVNGLPAGDRDIAFVFQFYALYPHMSAYDNIAFPLRAQKLKKDEVETRVQQVADLLQIQPILKRRPSSLPSGEQQRVALGRAMVRRPQVFLMDEPLTNLDASLRTDMRTELKYLQADIGTTMVYVTHDQTEAMSMAHRIAIMNLGVLQQVGTPLEVYNNPNTRFVAGFIGSPPMNFVPCQWQGDAGLSDANGGFTVSNTRLSRIQANHKSATGSVILGVRAEDIRLTANLAEPHLRGRITVREPLGDETVYVIEVGDQTLHAKTEPTIIFQPGDTVGIRFNEDQLHIFDAETETVIRETG